MSLTVLDPRIHFVKDTHAARFFRRRLRCDDVLTFWNEVTKQWILGMWIHEGTRAVEEFEDLGPNMEAITDDFVDMIVGCYGTVDLQKTKSRLLSKNRDRIREQTDAIYEDQERWDWLRKQTQDKAPVPYVFQG